MAAKREYVNVCEIIGKARTPREANALLRALASAQLYSQVVAERAPEYMELVPYYTTQLYLKVISLFKIYYASGWRYEDAFLDQVLARLIAQTGPYLYSQIGLLLEWRIRFAPGAGFPTTMLGIYSAVQKLDELKVPFHLPPQCMVALRDALRSHLWDSGDFALAVESVSALVEAIPVEIFLSEEVVKSVSPEYAPKLLQLAVSNTEGHQDPYLPMVFIANWNLTAQDFRAAGIKLREETIYCALNSELSGEALRRVIRRVRKEAPITDEARFWSLVLARKDYDLCRWLLHEMLLIPDPLILKAYEGKEGKPDRKFLAKLNELYRNKQR